MSRQAPTLASDTRAQLIAYIAERTEPTQSRAGIGIEELFADYRAWCKEGSAAGLELEEFMQTFDALRASPELEDNIKKFGTRYFGIDLAGGRERRGRVQSVA